MKSPGVDRTKSNPDFKVCLYFVVIHKTHKLTRTHTRSSLFCKLLISNENKRVRINGAFNNLCHLF
jgi:hypothetical protein